MAVLLGKNTLNELKKDYPKLVLLCLIPTLVYVGLLVFFILTSSRAVMHLYPILLSVVSSAYVTYLLFYFVIILRSHLSLKRVCNDALTKTQFEGEVTVTQVNKKYMTVRGVSFYSLTCLDEGREITVFVLPDAIDDFEVDKTYKVRLLHSMLVSYEDVNYENK